MLAVPAVPVAVVPVGAIAEVGVVEDMPLGALVADV